MGIKITLRPVANNYAMPGERIVEYSNDKGEGGLISFRDGEDGKIIVEPHRHDANVEIHAEGTSWTAPKTTTTATGQR